MEKLNRAYNLFIAFQIATLAAGILAILLTHSGLYVFLLFGQVIAMIVFSIITSNLSERDLRRKYPEVRPDQSFSAGPGGFRFGVDWRRPLKERAKKSRDQLAQELFRKQEITWVLLILTVIGLYALAAVVY